MTSLPPALLILGGSTRAAAGSAVRAGFRPICADRFGDEDLQRLATVLPVCDYPRGLLTAVESLPPTPWLYVGAIENEPELIDAISRRHPLLGNSPDVLQRIRDPFWIERTLRTHELPALRTLDEHELPATSPLQPSSAEHWLIKPFRSGGGIGIRHWDGTFQERDRQQRMYFQEWREGRSISAIFVADIQQVRLIGMSEQLIGHAYRAPTDFGYAGSIGPLEFSPPASQQIQQIVQHVGTLLANASGLLGLFGCDFILADDIPWLTEVNPRYTASVEILERATNWPLLKWHVAACLENHVEQAARLSDVGPKTNRRPAYSTFAGTPVIGKRIVFASSDSRAPDFEKQIATNVRSENSNWQSNDAEPLLADIPTPGSSITSSWPICTVFAHSNNSASCRDLLEQRAFAIERWTEQPAL